MTLEAAGHQVREAREGREGMRLLRERPADLVFCDLHMPGQEGLETIQELRRDFPGLPVVVMSAAAPDMLHIAVLLGATTALAKPFTIADVLTAAAAALDGSPPT